MGNFNTILKNLRLRENMTQLELANRLEVSKSAISMYENGNRVPELEQLKRIADLFHVDMDYLTGREFTEAPADGQRRVYEPTYEDIQSLIARNGNRLSLEQKKEIIKTLLSDD